MARCGNLLRVVYIAAVVNTILAKLNFTQAEKWQTFWYSQLKASSLMLLQFFFYFHFLSYNLWLFSDIIFAI